jgi:hypothetical protein
MGDIFAAVDAEAFQRCFITWIAALVGTPAEVIAIDGKTSRRSGQKTTGQKTSGKAPIHMVAAFAVRAGCSSRAHACRARPEPP